MALQNLIKVYKAEIMDGLNLDSSISFAGRLKIDRRYSVLDLSDLSDSIYHYIMIDSWDLIADSAQTERCSTFNCPSALLSVYRPASSLSYWEVVECRDIGLFSISKSIS